MCRLPAFALFATMAHLTANPTMSPQERIFQAILFETLLVALMTLLTVWLTQYGTGETGALMIAISVIALIWNVIFNWLFDKKFSAPRETRSLQIRMVHAVLFEGGLLLVTLPLIMVWLKMNFWQALMMDIAMTIFVLIYTVVFHWIYDNVRAKWFQAS